MTVAVIVGYVLADTSEVTQPHTIECLHCGARRAGDHPEPECSRCGYLGWAPSESLTERTRRLLRERAPHTRRLRRVA